MVKKRPGAKATGLGGTVSLCVVTYSSAPKNFDTKLSIKHWCMQNFSMGGSSLYTFSKKQSLRKLNSPNH